MLLDNAKGKKHAKVHVKSDFRLVKATDKNGASGVSSAVSVPTPRRLAQTQHLRKMC